MSPYKVKDGMPSKSLLGFGEIVNGYKNIQM